MQLLSSDRLEKVLEHKDNLGIQWWCKTVVYNDVSMAEALVECKQAREAGLKIIINCMVSPDNMPHSPWFRHITSRYNNKPLIHFLDEWHDFIGGVSEYCQPDILEVFSEHNCVVSWGAGTVPDDYVLLLRLAREACRRQQVVGIGGFTATVTWDWFDKLLSAGAERFADLVCTHPYSHERDLNTMLDKMDEWYHNISKAGMPIYITEFGLPATGNERKPLTSCVPPFNQSGIWGLADYECAIWWSQLLPLWAIYCKTAACYVRPFEDVEYLFEDKNYWGLYIGNEGKPSYDAIKQFFGGQK